MLFFIAPIARKTGNDRNSAYILRPDNYQPRLPRPCLVLPASGQRHRYPAAGGISDAADGCAGKIGGEGRVGNFRRVKARQPETATIKTVLLTSDNLLH